MAITADRTPAKGRGAAITIVTSLVATLVVAVIPTAARAAVFSNPTAIIFSDYYLLASPYPSQIEVTGLTGTITDVNVLLDGVTHERPEDVDLVLIGPPGTGYAVLMADTGRLPGQDSISGVALEFDDGAPDLLPCSARIDQGWYRPTNCGSYTIDPALTNTSLSVFNGKAANGTWELYGGDDTGGIGGRIAGGWVLEILTNGPTSTSFAPTSGPVGTSVAIEGTNLTGATAVRFGGVAATSFTVDSATRITAAVPQGAVTGPIAVTTPGGTATSAASFTVTTDEPTATEHSREVSLSLGRAKARGKVTVTDGFGECLDNVRVKVQRRQEGRWRPVGSDATTADGRYIVPTPGPGAYRAIAKRFTLSSGDVCLKDFSPTVRRSL
jgi:hypothetical protein